MSSILWDAISHKTDARRDNLRRIRSWEREDTGALMGRGTKISSKKFIMVTRGGGKVR